MASQFDDSDFIDRDYQSSQAGSGAAASLAQRPPTSQELDTQVGEAQRKLAELRRAQEELERERAALEEARRRRLEFQSGREEMLRSLTRGLALLEQAEFAARRDSEQMGKTLAGLRDSLAHIQAIQEESWTQDNWNVELTKALAAIENARMEWNGARLKWPLLEGKGPTQGPHGPEQSADMVLTGLTFWQLCRIGVALTWPVAVVGVLALVLLVVMQLR